MKIYFSKYSKKYKQILCANSHLVLYILKGLTARINVNTVLQISFFRGLLSQDQKKQSERLYFISSIFIGVKKTKKPEDQLSDLSFSPKYFYVSLFIQCAREFPRLYYILTHTYDVIDVLLNFKIILTFSLTSSTITMSGPRKWKYTNLNISGTMKYLQIKKAYFIFLKGHLTEY